MLRRAALLAVLASTVALALPAGADHNGDVHSPKGEAGADLPGTGVPSAPWPAVGFLLAGAAFAIRLRRA